MNQSQTAGLRRTRSLESGAVLRLLSAVLIVGAESVSAGSVNPLKGPSIQVSHLPAVVASHRALAIGPAAAAQRFQLGMSLPTHDQAGLDLLLHDLQDPQSPRFHQYLSSEEYTARFGPTQAEYDAVLAWARANGFHVTGTTPNRRLVSIEGDADIVNRAFNVTMTEYQHPSEDRAFFSADREPTTSGLDVPLLQIAGLNNYIMPHPHLLKGNAPVSRATGSGPSGEFLPSDMRAAYYGSGALTGAGQSIGILSFDGYKASDVQLYYSSTGMSSSVPINNVLVNGYSGACVSFNSNGTINTSVCDDREQILDIVNAIGMAPGISQVLFYEVDPSDPSGDTKMLNQMATDNLAKVLSCSWGWSAHQATDDAIFQQMAAQGQTFVSASGDFGAWGVGSSQTVNAEYPSQSAYILQVGGTDLTTNGAGGAWSSETAWSNSGGGWDSSTPIPSWQQIAGVITASNNGSTSYRNAPDVAMEANFDNPTVNDGQFLTGYGGTSFAAPRWAGFVALINQQSVANGKGPVGFFNSTLYNLGVGPNYSSNFHDIASGSNPAVNSKQQVIVGGPSFNAVAGYDLVTGWGSPRAAFIATLVNAQTSKKLYTALNPARLLDTRTGASTVDGTAQGTGSIAAVATYKLPVAGRAGIPADAVAVAFNVTPANPTTHGYVTVWSGVGNAPNASNLNLNPGDTIPNLVISQLDGSGNVVIFNGSNSAQDIVVDAQGYFPAGSSYVPMVPQRYLDTRSGFSTVDGQDQGIGALASVGQLNLGVAGRTTIPATGVEAAVFNLTAISPSSGGYITAWPTGLVRPNASNLNLNRTLTIPNLVISGLGSGKVSIFNGGVSSIDLVADVQGWFPSNSGYLALAPARLLDTRSGQSTIDGQYAGTGALAGGGTLDLTVTGRGNLPTVAKGAVVLNVTSVQPSRPGYITVWPSGVTQPLASNLNLNPNTTIANLVIVKIGSNGKVSFYNGSTAATDLVVDVQGWLPDGS